MANPIHTDALALLNACVASLEDAKIDPPDLVRIYGGDPPDDCSHLTVWLSGYFNGSPGLPVNQPEPCGGPATLEFSLVIKRCLTVSPHPRAEEEEDAEALMADVWAIRRGLRLRHARGDLFGERQVLLGPTLPALPLADIGGYLMTVQVEVWG